MGRGYGCPMLPIAKLCFLTMLILHDVRSYPHRVYRNMRETGDHVSVASESSTPGNIDQLSSQSATVSRRNQSQDEFMTLLQKAFQNGELFNIEEWYENNHHGRNRTEQRDTSKHQNTYTTNSQDRTEKGQLAGRRLFGDHEVAATQSDGKIVFPDDDMSRDGDKFDVTPVPVCQGSTFCESASFYPESLVSQAIHRNDSIKYLAGVDVVSDVIQRIDVTDDIPLCISTEQVVYPKTAENKRKEWQYVVNQEDFKQGVRIETCNNENGDCSVIDGLAEGYKTTCRQKYIYRQLASVSDNKVVPEMFKFPSSCCCHLKFTGSPLSRMGVRIDRQTRKK